VKYYDEISQEHHKSMTLKCGCVTRQRFSCSDFVILDVDIGDEALLILGRPFLSTADAQIDVGAGLIHLHINVYGVVHK
jgi:hypothetical protein